MSETQEAKQKDELIDDEDKRQSFDDEMEWWILASST
jgi:hypothetical protein